MSSEPVETDETAVAETTAAPAEATEAPESEQPAQGQAD